MNDRFFPVLLGQSSSALTDSFCLDVTGRHSRHCLALMIYTLKINTLTIYTLVINTLTIYTLTIYTLMIYTLTINTLTIYTLMINTLKIYCRRMPLPVAVVADQSG